MYRTALRSASRPVCSALRTTTIRSAPRRFASTASPADKPRSVKSSALRWGLAVAAVYFYNTSPVFAEEAAPQTVSAPASFAEDDLPTVDSVITEKRKQIQSKLDKNDEKQPPSPTKPDPQVPTTAVNGSPAALEEESDQQGAFNPETGEINWDCPCLGGMAHGPCGEEFKTAFSCFVYSQEEPKGMDCIEKFQGMQECFKKYPDIYGSELADDEAEEAPDAVGEPPVPEYQKPLDEPPAAVDVKDNKLETHNLPGVARSEDEPVPKKWEDARAANDEVEKEGKP